MEATGIDTSDLGRRAANHVPLTPISFLVRAARVHAGRTAVIHGDRRFTYAGFAARCRRLASALRRHGVRRGDTVAVLAPNVPALLEAHFGVPMAGGVLNAINTRLDPEAVAFILRHGRARVLIADRELSGVAGRALDLLDARPFVVEVDDPGSSGGGRGGEALGAIEYEDFLAAGSEDDPVDMPADEWQDIALNYTSGTTGDPKGAVYHHRGAYLNACGNALALGLGAESVYLWTLPMFHCNGWSHPWAVTLAGGTHVCLRRVEPRAIFAAVAAHGVTHMAGAPVVLNMLVHAPEGDRAPFAHRVQVATGGAAPPSAVIAGMERMGFRVTHLYGLTETYGPATVCVPAPGLDDLTLEERAAFMARQGLNHPMLEEVAVLDPRTMAPVPADGATIGELMLRGNTVMKGYLGNPRATAAAFEGDWLHTGDLAVMHPDGYVEIKDRSKDIIISGGENVSSLEVEEVLYRHPDVMEAAVVARPDPRWGETPHAFVAPRPEAQGRVDEAAILAWCRGRLAGFKCPRHVTFGPLPKTSTGKVQKFLLREAAREEAARGSAG
jgi:fatty-acyl-CoA synthase